MQRLADHFKDALPAPDNRGNGAVPAEHEHGRPALREGHFRGLPLWYHDGVAAGVATDEGDAFDPDDAIACFQFEHYVDSGAPAGGEDRRLKQLYYLLKPLMPRALQVGLQRVNARRRLQAVEFPAWPEDATLTELLGALLADRMRAADVERVPFLGFWPAGKTWAWCLTHDVETTAGQIQLEPMARAEEQRGVRSSWNFVPERYPVDRGRMDDLRERGHEIGVHGLQHSGKLFSSRAEFERRCRKINSYVQEWGAVGFRSPATYRNPFWLPEIDVDYDSSFMDNATLEPQRGGVCSAYPYMLSERMVELPITLPMDHTLINIMRLDVVPAFASKLDWIRGQQGLAVALFHPDYNTSADAIERYGAVIDGLNETPRGWYALPREIADWWQRRRRSRVVLRDGAPHIEGPVAADGTIWWVQRDGGRIRIEPPA
jgi:peptidoglycan/xylan/chitin deacetylase (PgdA/CDA1 family)